MLHDRIIESQNMAGDAKAKRTAGFFCLKEENSIHHTDDTVLPFDKV
jgi:hypothetical protein